MNDEIDSNKVVAVDEKLKHLKKFIALMETSKGTIFHSAYEIWKARFPGGTFAQFCVELQARLVMGSLKYGDTWKFIDLGKEIDSEALDLAVYDYLTWLKKETGGHWSQKAIAGDEKK